MKVLLLNPPQEHRIYSEVPEIVNAEVCILPPLGLLYLEAYLAENSGHEVKVLDAPALKMNKAQALESLAAFNPQVLGITGHTQNLVDMLEFSEAAKETSPGLKIVWGGAHASAFPESAIRFEPVDAVICGEGETSFAQLLSAYENKFAHSEIPGLYYKTPEQIVFTGAALPPDLSRLPRPRRQILDYKKYYYFFGESVTATSLSSSRGCPYHCTFCSTPGKSWRARTPQDVAQELQECADLGIKEIYFIDDTFNVDRSRVIELANEILKRKLKISWNFRARLNLIDMEMLQACQAAGCTRIQVGVESGSDEGLKNLGKELTIAQIKAAFKLIKSTKISAAAYFLLGAPHEKTFADIKATINFAKTLNADYCLFGLLTPYPNTELYAQGVALGIVDPKIWEDYVSHPYPEFKPPLWTQWFSENQLLEYLDYAYKSFYLRPSFILKNLRQLKNLSDLKAKIKAGLSILKL
jgi:anaerobic magnesium-protoporphyrin IX monomethyl ester cyclase